MSSGSLFRFEIHHAQLTNHNSPENPYIAHPKCIQMTETKTTPSIFSKDNYIWMAIGAAVITIGMFLMSGGGTTDPAVFNKDEVYSTTRITIAPILILLGLAIEIYAIFKKPKKPNEVISQRWREFLLLDLVFFVFALAFFAHLARLIACLGFTTRRRARLRGTHLGGQLGDLGGQSILILLELLVITLARFGAGMIDVRGTNQAVQLGEEFFEELFLGLNACQFVVALQNLQDLLEQLNQFIVLVLGAIEVREVWV